jgi:hypothetical protein
MLTKHARKDQEPVTDPRLASLLDAAAAPAEPGPASGEAAALAAFRSSPVRAHRRFRMHIASTPLKSLAVAAASAGLLLTGGIAAANAGALPGAAQDTARDALATVGVQVPGANEHSAGHADTRGPSDEAPLTGGGADSAGTLPDAAGFGQMISELARSTESGPEKGKTISQAASANGQAHRHAPAPAPEQSSASAEHAQAPDAAGAPAEGNGGQSGDQARVVTPNGGGTGTAGDASADNGGTASAHGTDKADTASGGRSAAGSDNRP